MNIPVHYLRSAFASRIAFFVMLLVCSLVYAGAAWAQAPADESTQSRTITIYDQGEKRVVLTKAGSVQQTLTQAGIALAPDDKVEPALDTQYATHAYTINIYRAYPVMIVDGMKREQVLTPYSSPRDIARDAGVSVRAEDKLELSQSTDVLADGVGTRLTITRALPVTLVLYGVPTRLYTQATTVEELLREKNITLAAGDTVSLPLATRLSSETTVEVWRDGVQTATVEETVPFTVRTVLDADLPVGHREIRTPGVAGKRQVAYEITRADGQEVSRQMIQSVVVTEPKEQIEVLGNKGANPLTAAKGAHHFVDSKGVGHRETYYDLPMNVLMGACGGGDYTVRSDGAKVDKDGYILIAANLGNYPRCSVVETSMGLGKVYDTGGFAAVHPHGFDLATDWTNRDGR